MSYSSLIQSAYDPPIQLIDVKQNVSVTSSVKVNQFKKKESHNEYEKKRKFLISYWVNRIGCLLFKSSVSKQVSTDCTSLIKLFVTFILSIIVVYYSTLNPKNYVSP